ncbi:MAG TPA: AAA family ATPase, partial [Chloroflexaceae bacterium]|nr:AAA family ATPase [Chloroflexaceae bacterium]
RRCVPVFAAFELPRRPEALHPLVAHVQAVVRRWGGWLNEIEIGDKGAVFVLLFGAPVARGDDASRAVGCCLELCERGLVTRVGITLGWLFVGAVGSPQRRVYTAQGDDMNLAAHLMQLAPQGAILVSGRVRNDVLGRYSTSAPTIAVTKGHALGVPVSRIIPVSRGDGGHVRLPGSALPDGVTVVGRTAERMAMAEAAATAAAGRRSLILLEGESGIGKSCLLQELFAGWVAAGHTGYSAECSSGEAPVPLAVWRPIIQGICGVDEGAPPQLQQAHIEGCLALVPADLRGAGPLVARALGLAGAGREAAQPLGAAETRGLVALAVALIAAHTGDAPLLLVLEDIHWADEASLALAAALARQGPPRLCLALSHRPLDGPQPPSLRELRTNPGCVRIEVSRLTGDESLAMIREQLGVGAVGSKLGQYVERHTEGQPLFIKEYLRVLRQHQLVRVEEGVADLARPYVSVQVSNSAQGIVQARVDRLDEATRLTLKVAAVLGSTFQLRLLGTVHPGRPSSTALREQLDTLVALQILDLELEGPERVYRFKHGIAHEVAYRSLLFGQRRQLHAAVADWYEDSYAAEISDGAEPAVYDQLIRHLGGAEEWELQAHYCLVAARVAARHYAVDTALRYIEQGLVFVRVAERRFGLLLLRVALNERAGNYVSQAHDLAQLGELAAYLRDPLAECCAGLFRLRFLLSTGVERRAAAEAPGLRRRLRRLARSGEGAGRDEAELLAIACLEAEGAALTAADERDVARRLLRRALGRCRTAPPSEVALLTPDSLAARCLDGIGALDLAAGRHGAALRLHRQALDLAGATGDWGAEVRARVLIGQAHLGLGELAAAFVEARAALTKSNAIGDRAGQVGALRLLAAISAAEGNYAEAERDVHLAATFSAAARARGLEVQTWEELARYAAAQGLDDDAAEARREAERLRRHWWGEQAPAEAARR